jgi:Holliday junction resolvasome RuvABC endonuclease subunit
MHIVALDCSTSTGWAVLRDSETPTSGVQKFQLARNESAGMRFIAFRSFLIRLLGANKGAIVVWEQAHHRGGAATEVCVGMTTRVMEIAAMFDMNCAPIHSREVKKWATGNGNASKELMQKAAAEKFDSYNPDTDPGADEADALLLGAFAQWKWGGGERNE